MTVYVTDANVHVQRLISVVKMVIVLEGYTAEEHRSVVQFLCVKGLNAKDIHKAVFSVYGGMCSRLGREILSRAFESRR
jgi:hypothetical protein